MGLYSLHWIKIFCANSLKLPRCFFKLVGGSEMDSLMLCVVTQAEFVTAILSKFCALVYALWATHPLYF